MDLLTRMRSLRIDYEEDDECQQLFYRSVAADIDQVSTEIVLNVYSNKTLLIVSQYQKFGTLFMIQKDQADGQQGADDIYTTKFLFGSTGEEKQVAARYLAEAFKIDKPLFIFINLKSYDIETVKAVKDIVLDIQKEQK